VIPPIDRLKALMDGNEDEHLEFKEAKNNYHFEKLLDYCAALANEGGGKMILGITDKKPRTVVGCQAFDQPARTVSGLVEKTSFEGRM
jgi:ATP-dependent DNA helicase RecG